MKTKRISLFIMLLLGISTAQAQEKKTMSLKDAISLVISTSNEATLANTKVTTSKLELETLKNSQYPTAKLSVQYMRLAGANVKSNFGGNGLDINQLMLGQASVSMPVFSGLKLKNSIDASENLYKSQTFSASHTKEELALEVTELFADLYKSQELVKLFKENLKSAQQRTKDFSNMVDNGLMARNDLLKAQLQESNIQLSMDNAIKNVNIINYQLVTLLRLPENTIIDIDVNAVRSDMTKNQLENTSGQRNDLEALTFQQKASEAGIKIAKAGYYPSLALTGGYSI